MVLQDHSPFQQIYGSPCRLAVRDHLSLSLSLSYTCARFYSLLFPMDASKHAPTCPCGSRHSLVSGCAPPPQRVFHEHVLALIFHTLVFDTDDCQFHRSHSPFVVAAVSHQWREIALSCSRLWTHILFQANPPIGCSPRVSSNEVAWNTFLTCLRARFGAQSLSIFVDLDGILDAGQQRMLAAVKELIPRADELVIHYWSDSVAGRALKLLRGPMPQLTCLTVGDHIPQEEEEEDVGQQVSDSSEQPHYLDAPRLYDLQWQAGGIPSLTASALQQLRVLVLHAAVMPRFIWSLVHGVRHRLEELDLKCLEATDVDAPPGEIALPCLWNLIVRAQAWCIFGGGHHESFNIPNVRTLGLAGWTYMYRHVLSKAVGTVTKLAFLVGCATEEDDIADLGKLTQVRELSLHGTPARDYMQMLVPYWPRLQHLDLGDCLADWRDVGRFAQGREKLGFPELIIAMNCTHSTLTAAAPQLVTVATLEFEHVCGEIRTGNGVTRIKECKWVLSADEDV